MITHSDLVLQYGWTALYQASLHGRLSVVKILLEHGASVDVQDTVSACLECTQCTDVHDNQVIV